MRTLGILLGVVALTLAAAEARQKPAPKDEATEKLLIDNERALYEAAARRDGARFQSLVDPGGVWTTPSGFIPMNLLAGGLEGFQLPAWGAVNAHVIWTDGEKDSALLLYTRTGGGTFGGHTVAPMMLASTLWTKRDGRWLAVHHQETELRQ